jgi:hypothetical protein
MKRLIVDKAVPRSLVLAFAAVAVGAAGLLALTLLNPKAPPAPPPAPEAPAYVAERPNRPEFAACEWNEVRGAKLSIWSFACGPGHGGAHLEPDSSLPGFWMVVEGGERYVAVRTFANPRGPEGPMPAIRIASPGPDTATCTLVPASGLEGLGRYVFAPTGKAKARWEKAERTGEYVEPPCGPLGVDVVGDRYFWPMPGHPDVMVYADMGSELQIFEPSTLRLVAQ